MKKMPLNMNKPTLKQVNKLLPRLSMNTPTRKA